MKKLLILLFAVVPFTGCAILGRMDQAQLQQATAAALTAASITDEQVIALSKRTVEELDAKYPLADASYQKRLSNLMSGINDVEGLKINYKVYKTDEINAFACGDGSIRVYSGLMDLMDDDELMAIIGHECGHVVHQDSKNAMKKAYMASAARDIVGSAGTLGAISSAVMGDISEAFIQAQFSQKQEFAADEYGFNFAIANGKSPYSMATALEKIVKLQGQKASEVAQMFSSHPDSEKRASLMREKANKYILTNKR